MPSLNALPSVPTNDEPVLSTRITAGNSTFPLTIHRIKPRSTGRLPVASVKIDGGDMQSIPLVQSGNCVDLGVLRQRLASGTMKLNLATHSGNSSKQYLVASEVQGFKAVGKNADVDDKEPVLSTRSQNVRAAALRALASNSVEWTDWYALGWSLGPDETVKVMLGGGDDGSVSEIQVGRKDCFKNALELNTAKGIVWNNFGTTLEQGERVDIEQPDGSTQSVGRVDCFLKAVALQPSLAVAWANLAKCSRGDESTALEIATEQNTPRIVSLSKTVCEQMAKYLAEQRPGAIDLNGPDAISGSGIGDARVASGKPSSIKPNTVAECNARAWDELLTLVKAASDMSGAAAERHSDHASERLAFRALDRSRTDSEPKGELAEAAKGQLKSASDDECSALSQRPLDTAIAHAVPPSRSVAKSSLTWAGSKRSSQCGVFEDSKQPRLKRAASECSFDSICEDDLVVEGREVDESLVDILSQIKYTPSPVTTEDLQEFEAAVSKAKANGALNTSFTSRASKNVRLIDFAASYGRLEFTKLLHRHGALNSDGQNGRLQISLAKVNEGRYNSLGRRVQTEDSGA